VEFLNLRNLLVIFLIWGLAFAGLLAWHQKYQKQVRETAQRHKLKAEKTKPFQFDEPTPEEQKIIDLEQQFFDEYENFVTVPLINPISVFSCPKDNCEILGQFEPGIELVFDVTKIDPEALWLPISWPDPYQGPEAGYLKIEDLERASQETPPLPEIGLDVEGLELEPVDPVPINPQTIVGIVCDFYNFDTHETRTTRGSGVIVTEDGHILTARSIVDLNYLNEGLEDYQLQHCLIGQLPGEQNLPEIEAIKNVNAFIRIPFLPYKAELISIPIDTGLSTYEQAWLDFAVIKINDLNPDAQYFGFKNLPETFPFAPVLISDLPKVNEQVLSFGFPSGTTIGHRADIRTLFVQGLLSHITNYWAGDERFKDDLFMIEAALDTEDTAGGRFGSPIFWKGYVIGVHTVKQRQTLQTFNVAVKAVLEKLFDDDVIIPLEVY